MTRFRILVCMALFVLSVQHAVMVKAQQPLRIMAMGNSITYGWETASTSAGDCEGYRYELFNLLNAAGYNFDFVGHNQSGYNVSGFTDYQHCGVPSIRATELATLLSTGTSSRTGYVTSGSYLNSYPADIILLHIGTNDMLIDGNDSFSGITQILNAIDSYETSTGNPVLVLVARIINQKNTIGCQPGGAYWQIEHFNNNRIVPGVNARIANGDKLVLVDMMCGAGIDYNADMRDAYHPTQTGYEKMAHAWFDAIDGLHTAPVIAAIPNQQLVLGGGARQINLDSYFVSDDYATAANMTWVVTSNPAHFSVSINSSRIATITPVNGTWLGSENITFRAYDNGRYVPRLAKWAEVTSQFTVLPANDKPVIAAQLTNYLISEDHSFNLVLSDFQITDDNPSTDWHLNVLAGTHYTVSGNKVTPAQDYATNFTVNVTVDDGSLTSDVFAASVQVMAVNDLPRIDGSSSVTLDEDTEINLTRDMLEVYDPDNSGSQLTLSVLDGEHYSYSGTTLSPEANYNGSLAVQVRVCDPLGCGSSYSLPVTVTPVNDPPVVRSIPDTLGDDHHAYRYQIVAEDVDNDPITFTAASALPGWLSLNASDGLLCGSPILEDTGEYPIALNISDGQETVNHNFKIRIAMFNTAPYFTEVPRAIENLYANVSFNYTIEAADDDANDTLILYGVYIPSFLTFIERNGRLMGTPGLSDIGYHVIEFGATDLKDTTTFSFVMNVKQPSDLESLSNVMGVQVYPNPAESVLTIEMNEEPFNLRSVQLVDISGRVVYDDNYGDFSVGSLFRLNVSALPNGYYTLLLNSDSGRFTQKVIINRN